jgi:hypothetical protein
VVGLHLYRRQAKPRQVSATFLWESIGSPKGSGRTRQPLHQSPSFWLELLAVLLITLVLAGPQGCAGRAEHRVVVLDDSASMQASHEEAREALQDSLKGLRARDTVSVVLSGPSPRMLVGPQALREEAKSAMDRWEPAAPDHSLGMAVDLGLQLSDGGAVTLISDHFAPDAWPEEVGLISVGKPANNIGLTHASRVRGAKNEDLVFVVLRSFSGSQTTGTLSLWEGEQQLWSQGISLASEQSVEHNLPIPHSTGLVRLELSATKGNALAGDDEAWLAPLPPRTLGVHLALPPEQARALGLDPEGKRWADLLQDAVVVSPERAHLILGPAGLSLGPKAWSIEIPAAGESQALLGPFLLDKEHPLTRGMNLEGVLWSVPSGSTATGASLISAGQSTLLSQDERRIQVHIDPAKSTLSRSPDWPIFLLNAAELRRASLPGLSQSSTHVGQELLWRNAAPGSWILTDPNGQSRALPEQTDLDIGGLYRPGVWTLQRDQDPASLIAVNALDPLESELRALGDGKRDAAVPAGAAQDHGVKVSETAILVLLLLVFALDWWALRNNDSLRLPGAVA